MSMSTATTSVAITLMPMANRLVGITCSGTIGRPGPSLTGSVSTR